MRSRLMAAGSAGLVALAAGGAQAQGAADAYPAKPVTIIVAQTPGGPNDIEARLYLGKMQGLLGQPFVLDFKPGAGSVIGTQYEIGRAHV